jgi:hypothetical protein
METSPFNSKLHKLLMDKGYKYMENPRYDRYDHANGTTVYYYLNGYIIIIDSNGEPVSQQITKEIRKAL